MEQISKSFRSITVIAISAILIFSFVPYSSIYASSVSYSFPTTPSDGNLSNTPSANSDSPKIVTSGSDVYVVWRDGNEIFFANSIDNGEHFAGTVDIGNATTSFSGDPQLATEGNNIFTVWRDNKDVKFNRSTNNGVDFEGAEIVLSSSTNSLTSTEPQIALSDSSSSNPDDLYFIWRDIDSGDNDIIFVKSSDNGANFGTLKSLGASDANFASPQVNTVGDNVYTIWQTSSDILFKRSTDNGLSFGPTLDIGTSSGFLPSQKSNPQLAGEGDFVYAVWQDKTNVKFARSTDGGASFGAVQDIGNTAGTSVPGTPQIEASGPNVYVLWRDDTGNTDDIKFVKSSNNGLNFDTEINLSDNSGTSTEPSLFVTGSNIIIAWTDSTSGNKEILSKISTDSGDTFGGVTNISDNTGISNEASIVGSGGSVFVVWKDSTSGNNEILLKKGMVLAISVTFDESQYKLGESAQITVTDV